MFDKDEQEISQIIEMGLDAILSDRMTLEQFLAQHPDLVAEIRPELETAVWLVSRQEQVHTRPGFVPASKKRVLERIKQEASSQDAKHGFLGFLLPRFGVRWAPALVAAIIVLSSTGGLLSAAQGSLPGDQLYTVKRISEQVAEGITFNEMQRVELNSQYTGRRLDEAAALITGGKYEAAEPALDVFEQQGSRTVELLEGVSNQQLKTKEALAAAVEEDFLEQANRLQAMQAVSPAEMQGRLAQAQTASMQNARFAGNVGDEIHQSTATPTATPTTTFTATITTEPSQTPTVVETKAPAKEKTSQPNAKNMEDGTVSASPTPPGHVINTPRPTNVHRPTKAVKPEKPDDKSGSGSDKGRPGQELVRDCPDSSRTEHFMSFEPTMGEE